MKNSSVSKWNSSNPNLESWFEQLTKKTNKFIALRESVLRERKRERKAVRSLRKEVADLTDAQAVIQTVAAEVQNVVHKEIASVVSKCLSTVFSDPYTFQIRFEKKRGKTEAKLIFERDGLEVDPLDAAGGGVVDVATFALRLACILRSLPPLRRIVFLDEPFRHLHPDLKPIALKLVKSLAKETKTQFLIITHISKKKLKKAGFKKVVAID